MRAASTWLIGLALAVFLLGLSVVPLTIPGFTALVAARTSLSAEAGLPPSRMLEIAEQVRRFVLDANAPTLPEKVDGRSGFDAAAVSHLIDVRRVLAGARLATGVLALALAAALALSVARKRPERVGEALTAGAACSAGLVVICGLVATSDFEAFFSAFHGLFFSAGTWTFPYDSLLIQVFPEAFWMIAGVTWAGLVLAGAAVLTVAGHYLRRGSRTVETGSAPASHSRS